jgi:CubicO group peptidase (beta-lactamase class C family)
MSEIHGEVAPGFERVREAFAVNFEQHGEVGAAFAAYVGGKKVADLWGGIADETTGRPWAEDTVQLFFSTTKGLTAVCANTLSERGDLDVDAPVVEYWPEFAAAGKSAVTVRHLLCHQAGLPVVDRDLTLEQVLAWDPVIDALADQTPLWEPGTAHGYHAVTYGWLVGEVIRRISGKGIGDFFAAEVAGPLGLDLWIGLPEAEDHRAGMLAGAAFERPTDEEAAKMYDQFLGPDSITGRALMGPGGCFRGEGTWNRRDVRAAEIPAANGTGSARALARMYAALVGEVDGVRLLKPETVDRARTPLTTGNDRVLFFETKFGLGFMTDSLFSPFAGDGGFGHYGAGGSVGFAHPELGLGFGYVMNKMQTNLAGDPRTLGLIDAMTRSLA